MLSRTHQQQVTPKLGIEKVDQCGGAPPDEPLCGVALRGDGDGSRRGTFLSLHLPSVACERNCHPLLHAWKKTGGDENDLFQPASWETTPSGVSSDAGSPGSFAPPGPGSTGCACLQTGATTPHELGHQLDAATERVLCRAELHSGDNQIDGARLPLALWLEPLPCGAGPTCQ
jgi:hypothetical protein